MKPRFEQRHALAGRGEQRAVLGDSRAAGSPSGSRSDDHVAHGVQEDDVVGPVELLGEPAEHLDQVGPVVAAWQLVAEVVHDDFGVGVARQVVVGLRRAARSRSSAKLASWPLKAKANHFHLQPCCALERLGVAAVVAAAGGVADVADGGPAGVLLHDALELAPGG